MLSPVKSSFALLNQERRLELLVIELIMYKDLPNLKETLSHQVVLGHVFNPSTLEAEASGFL